MAMPDAEKSSVQWRFHWRSKPVERAIGLLIYVLLTIATTWPLILSPCTTVPMGATQTVTVPLFNVWTIWWNADRAAHGFIGYWDAPIFHPAHDAFAFSEPQLTTLIVAPIIWIGGSRVLAYNAYLWLSLVLNGVFAERLLRVLKVRSWAAIAGGAAMVMLPIVHWQLDVAQLAPIWGVLWTWTACWQMVRMPETARWQTVLCKGAESGVALSMTFHACGHHGLFLGLLIVATGWLLPSRWRDRRLWLSFASACLAVALLVGPFAVSMTRAMKNNNFIRTDELIGSLSALPQDYLAAPGLELIDVGEKWCRPYWRLAPGWMKVSLASVAIVVGLCRRRTRRWTVFMMATIGIAFALSLGANLRVGDWRPYLFLTRSVPGLSQVRNVFRFAFFVQIATTLLSAQATWWLWLIVSSRLHNSRRIRIALGTMVVGLAGIAALEVRPYPLRLGDTPNAVANSGWIEFIKNETPTGSAIVCLPFPKGYQVQDFEQTTRWMYYGTYHAIPMINGYSGFFPLEYFHNQDSINASLNIPEALSKFEAGKVCFVVANITASTETLQSASEDQLELVFVDPVGVNVYRLRRLSSNSLLLK